uniref:Copper-containing nitrite reductase n=1 Tax=Mesocestoides corti TaxID=53468 RepID=A0A5K3FZH2_MESCO
VVSTGGVLTKAPAIDGDCVLRSRSQADWESRGHENRGFRRRRRADISADGCTSTRQLPSRA